MWLCKRIPGIVVQGSTQRGDCPAATSSAASVAVAAASVRCLKSPPPLPDFSSLLSSARAV